MPSVRPIPICRHGISAVLLLSAFMITQPNECGEQAWRAVISASGEVRLSRAGKRLATVRPALYETQWRQGRFNPGKTAPEQVVVLNGRILAPGGAVVDTELRSRNLRNGVELDYTLSPRQQLHTNSLFVGLDLPIALVAGRQYSVDGKTLAVPAEFGEVVLWSGEAKTVVLSLKDAGQLTIAMEEQVSLLVQDNRRWGPSLAIRLGNLAEKKWSAGESLRVAFNLTSAEGIEVEYDTPVTIRAGEEWIPLDVELDIQPGSALDFSTMGLQDAPAGKHGYLTARPDGTFAFEDAPDKPVRFYGVNFCFGAHYITHEQADRLAERLARVGYNAVRVHHHEGELVTPGHGIDSIPVSKPPERTKALTSFEAPSHQAEKFGSRIRGYLHPPANGAYTFWISGDDEGQLWLSRSEDPDGKKLIASVPSWTGQRQWDKHEQQKSEPVQLEAGKKYYIEALHKEGELGDHLAVAWQPPDGKREVVPGTNLSPSRGAPGAGKQGTILWEFWPDQVMTTSTQPRPDKLDQLHYLLAAFKKRGLYITTDVYVSRPVLASEIWDEAEGRVAMNDFKMLVPVNERAFENWKEFARNFLGLTNPYTGIPLAQDPAVAWLSMINEGNPGNYIGRLGERVKPDWQRAWNVFLARRYATASAIEKAWGHVPGGDPEAGTVPLFTNIYDNSVHGRDLAAFLAETEARMFARMKEFLRGELKCKALLTNMNGWTNRVSTQAARAEYDYVDDHFYVDHPQFIERPWSLPSRCSNTSPIAAGAPGGRHCSFVRLLDKPFTISEYNYSGPGRFRGVGGILTGCLGALQGWDVIWRFTYSHSRGNLFDPSPIGYFDIAADPLSQAADRAAICLYLRGDMKPATHTVGITMTPRGITDPQAPNVGVAPGWHALAWVTRVGTFLAGQPGTVPADIVLPFGPGTESSSGGEVLQADPYASDTGQKVLALMRKKGWLDGNVTDLASNRLQSETGQIIIDAPRDVMVLNTPLTAGGYAPEGATIETDAVTVHMDQTYGTVWVSSVDGQPIRNSKRLILVHLTDLQNTGIHFGEKARQTLLAWGGLPHLVKTGAATVRVTLADPAKAKVWELATSGRRVAPMPFKVENGQLVVTVSTRNADGKARMTYEIVVQ